ncbi:MAG: AAA family ATPase [Gemmataceae bacterium]|nr:AAA family ATPase [Gemmataceae bacterium]
MGLKDIVGLWKEIAQSDHLIGVVIGVVSVVALWFFWLRKFFGQRQRDQLEQFRERVADLRDRCDDWRRRTEDARERHDRFVVEHRAESARFASDLRESRSEFTALQTRYADLQQVERELRAQIALLEEAIRIQPKPMLREADLVTLNQELASLKESLTSTDRMLAERTAERDDLAAKLAARQEPLPMRIDLNWLETFDGKIWDKKPESPPAFFSRKNRPVRFISVVNLKGGVGKTTTTANLGAALAHLGKRVLLVDLDYQGSLTSMCLDDSELRTVRSNKRFVERILEGYGVDENGLKPWTQRIANDKAFYLVPAEEPLCDVENQMMIKWFLQGSGGGKEDPRYVLRRVFHSAEVQDAFDIVLFDCPPRLTTACINALACSDYAVIPVLPDERSTEAVPRLLFTLRTLRQNHVCPDLAVLGVIANRTYATFSTKTLADREEAAWNYLKRICDNEMPDESIRYFTNCVKQFTNEAFDAARKKRFAFHAKNFGDGFRQLTDELLQAMQSREERG